LLLLKASVFLLVFHIFNEQLGRGSEHGCGCGRECGCRDGRSYGRGHGREHGHGCGHKHGHRDWCRPIFWSENYVSPSPTMALSVLILRLIFNKKLYENSCIPSYFTFVVQFLFSDSKQHKVFIFSILLNKVKFFSEPNFQDVFGSASGAEFQEV
jgi:hypothetical protein